MNNKQPVYTLRQIALWAANGEVAIPNVQRGFVWKPAQIENLWDSLLRGYPIGAFVMTQKENGNFEILDGQQRATSISLGFGTKTLRDEPSNRIRVFIDVDAKLNEEDARKYLFRVITKSHPWGYQKIDPSKPLTAQNIRIALNECYDGADPMNDSIDVFYPWDADLPIPFQFFINAHINKKDEDCLWQDIQQWSFWKTVFNRWKNKQSNIENEKALTASARMKIDAVNRAVSRMLDEEKGHKVPALYLDLRDWLGEEDKNTGPDSPDEIENLFVRLNAGGTPLAGEELNYSILKAHIAKPTQDVIEQTCEPLFKPSRFLTIAYRLYQQNKKSRQSEGLSMRIKPKQFQRSINKADERDLFESFLLKICKEPFEDDLTLLGYVRNLLAYHPEECNWGLPFLIYSKISDVAPELMLLLMYRILIKGDRFNNKTKVDVKEHRTMLGMLTLFMWFGKGENFKNHSKLLSNIWPAATALDKARFWSAETVERAYINQALLKFPLFKGDKQEYGIERLLDYNLSEKANLLNRFLNESGEDYELFLKKAIKNKDIVLYAQRHFLETYFSQQQYRLEDTSLPFDWDHISPNNFVYNRPRIPQVVKEWYQTNGNIRAWPYALNRMDSDKSPAIKLNPLAGNGENEALTTKWQNFIDNNLHIISKQSQIPSRLLEWSFCEDDWSKCVINNIRNEWRQVTRLIIARNLYIIKEWYEQFQIVQLRKTNHISIEDLFLNSKWDTLPSKIEGINVEFDTDKYINRVSTPFYINDSKLNFYFVYPDKENGYLEENEIQFGLFELAGNNYLKKMSTMTGCDIDGHAFKWIQNKYTLISCNFNSYSLLIGEIVSWIKELPINSTEKNVLLNNLQQMITTKFKNVIN